VRVRKRSLCLICLCAIVALGLASRAARHNLPAWVGTYVGDALWGAMFFTGFCLIWPRLPPWRAFVLALVTTQLIEISQLYHRPWIDGIRKTRVGGLLLGHDFLWSDVLMLIIGTTSAALCDVWFTRRASLSQSKR
jgi:hypothetical protein